MYLWVIIGVMTAAALVLVVLPFVRRARRAPTRDEYDLAVYRDQLQELETDLTRGVISAAEAEAARLEIQRRMLAADKGRQAATRQSAPARTPGATAGRWIALGLIAAAVPALAIALYLVYGSPNMTGGPFAEAPQAVEPVTDPRIEEAVAKLAQRLETQPDDLQGWLMLGRSYIALERYAKAADAFRQATTLSGRDPEVLASLGEALVYANGGAVTPEAEAAFEEVLSAAPDDPAARYYVALADAQAGRLQEAYDRWMDLAKDAPADAPWRAELVTMIRRAADQLGIEVTTIPQAPPSAPRDVAQGDAPQAEGAQPEPAPTEAAPAPGPTEEDVADAAQMSPEEQTEMIRGMVARLAARLAEEPDDLDGWMRLGRSYGVLGEREKARDAYAEAARLAPDDVAVLSAYARAILEASTGGELTPPELLTTYRKILALDANHPEALWFVGLAEARAGNAEAARELLERLLVQLPEGSQVRRAVESALDSL